MRWAIIQIPSMPIGKSCNGHRCPSMGLNGVSVREATPFQSIQVRDTPLKRINIL